MGDGTVLIKQDSDGDRPIDNVVVLNDLGASVYRQRVAVADSVTVTGTVTANLGTIDGAATETTLASLAADVANGVTINQPVAVTDNGGSLTVDGTFFQATQPVSIAATVATSTAAPTVARSGQKLVAVTNTAVALSAAAAVVGVIISGLAANAGNVYVGPSGVTTGTGFELQPGQATSIAIDDVAKVFVNGTAGDGVSWLGS